MIPRTLRLRPLALLPFLAVAATAADAAIFTVGPTGTHATIQGAIDAAVAAPGSDEIRVARGTYHERLDVDTEFVPDPGALAISGGWLPGFVERIDDPNGTVVDADRLGRALRVSCVTGEVEVSWLTFREGRVETTLPEDGLRGGGALLEAFGCRIALRDSAVIDNLVLNPKGVDFCACGGGIGILLYEDGFVELSRNTVAANEARNEIEGGVALGAGIYLDHLGASSGRTGLELTGNEIRANRVQTPNGAGQAAGLFIELEGASEIEVSDNVVLANQVDDGPLGTGSEGSAVILNASSCTDCRIEARRNEVRENFGHDYQFGVRCAAFCQVRLSDTLVADGDGGLGLQRFPGAGAILATNLTLTGNLGRGLTTSGSDISVINSILFGNGAPDSIDPSTTLTWNLTTDPLFADAAAGDYHPRLDSPAIEAGNSAPPGGLGPLDLDREARVQGSAVDIGAYELEGRGGGGSGLCALRLPAGAPAFVPDWEPVCRCLRDDTLRALRCGGLEPGLFPEIAIPLPLLPGQPIEARWTLHPWSAQWSGDYSLSAALLVGTKEEAVATKGKAAGKLTSKDLHETLLFGAPFAPATLRTRLQVLVPGAQQPFAMEMDVLLEPSPPQDPI